MIEEIAHHEKTTIETLPGTVMQQLYLIFRIDPVSSELSR